MNQLNHFGTWGLSLIIMIAFVACSHSYFHQEVMTIDQRGWHIDEPATFEFETSDTSSYLDFYFDLRNTDDYPYQNIYTFIDMRFPNGRLLRDTIHALYLADEAGKWRGKGVGSSYDNSIMYKRRKKLPLPGKYEISITHGMRDSLLVGLERVGIHIEASAK